MKIKLSPEGIVTINPETAYEKNWLKYWHEKHHDLTVKTYTTKESAAIVLEDGGEIVDSNVILFWEREKNKEEIE